MIQRLVVNGCSYMESYSRGGGHIDLTNRLNIPTATSIALPGSANSRIIRTTLKDSYNTSESTLYIVGLSFLGRTELPIARDSDAFEGKWISIQNQFNPYHKYAEHWTIQDSNQIINLKLKLELLSIDDRLEELMYQLLSTINDLKSRGHQVVVFKNPPDVYDQFLSDNKFTSLKKCVNIIDGLEWAAVPWQVSQDIQFLTEDYHLPEDVRHPAPGQHGPLNEFLVEYIKKNNAHLSIL